MGQRGVVRVKMEAFLGETYDFDQYTTHPRKIRGWLGLGVYDFVEDFWILCGDDRENLAVEQDLFLFQGADELGEGCTAFAGCGVDAHLLQGSVVTFFEFTIAIGVDAGFGGRDFRERDFGFAPPHHALGSGEDVFTAFDAVGSAFDSWHSGLGVRHHAFKTLGIGGGDGLIATLLASDLSRISAIEMILSSVTLEKFSAGSQFDPLGDSFVCFHRMSLRFAADDGRDHSSLTGDRLFNKELIGFFNLSHEGIDSFDRDFSMSLFAASH